MLSKRLTDADRAEVLRHHERLDPEDVRLRFGYQAHAEALHSYVRKLDFGQDALFGVFDARLQLQAVAHLAISPQNPSVGEFGVSVVKACRHQGMGLALLRRCIEQAANVGVHELLIQTLAENKPMLRLMLRHSANIETDGCERLAHMPIESGSVLTRLHEMGLDELASAQHLIDKTRCRVHALWQGMRHYRHHGVWTETAPATSSRA